MAVMITVMFEVWSEGKAPPYSPMTTALKPGTPDLLGISWSQYGGRTGVWRLMRILDECDVRGTVCLNAKCAEEFPDAVKQLHARGHEISGHSYTQDLVLPYLSAQEEKDVIQKCSRIIESVVGTRPVGWFSPVASPKRDFSGTAITTTLICPTRLTRLQDRWLRSRTAISPIIVRFAVAREIFTMCIKIPLIFCIAQRRRH
jgi:hypothetical protein